MSISRDEQPLVSVVTPVYNGADYIAECIESVLKQTYENWEYVIVDNRSTDDTLEIARGYEAREPRIRIVTPNVFVGVVESGNGRVLAFRRAYAQGMPSAERYRAHLKAQGYPIEGINHPVLVRIREGDAPWMKESSRDRDDANLATLHVEDLRAGVARRLRCRLLRPPCGLGLLRIAQRGTKEEDGADPRNR